MNNSPSHISNLEKLILGTQASFALAGVGLVGYSGYKTIFGSEPRLLSESPINYAIAGFATCAIGLLVGQLYRNYKKHQIKL